MMRVILIIAVSLIAACATDPAGRLSGVSGKNGGDMAVERLGAMTTASLPGELRCGAKQVMWCAGGRTREECQCVYVREAEERYRRMTEQLKRARF